MNHRTKLANLTRYERLGIELDLNLADGHARQFQDPAQKRIVDSLADLYLASESARQPAVEAEFQRAFYTLAGQPSAAAHPRVLLCSSASMAIDLVSALLAQTGRSVGLIQPCFDNLAGLLRRRGLRMAPVSESSLAAARPPRGFDALFITLPNNPTGFTLAPERFEQLARHCADSRTVLVVDWTFRFFDPRAAGDQYAVLERCGASYLCIEDTGKTWPTLDLKCSILAASADLYPALAELYDDLILNISPFILMLLTRYVEDSRARGLDSSVRQTVRVNRAALRRVLPGSVLKPGDGDADLSVEWVRIASSRLCSLDVVSLLSGVGIAILPGDHFFWHDPRLGSEHVRFALAREPSSFATACDVLADLIDGSPLLRGDGDR